MEELRQKEDAITTNIIRLLQQNYCQIDGFSIQREYQVTNTPWCADIVVLRNDVPFLVVEVKTDLSKKQQKDYGFYALYRYCVSSQAPWGLLTDGNLFTGYHLGGTIKDCNTFRDFLTFIRVESLYENKIDKPEFLEFFHSHFSKNIRLKDDDIIDNGIIIKLAPTAELKLFNELIKDIPSGTIYRYTSAATLFATLDNESQRMFAVEGMNDKEDCSFLEKKIYNEDERMLVKTYIPHNVDMYITSFTKISEDKLSMWRMYGNETKGVCLECSIQEKVEEGFYLRKVIYEGEPNYELLVSFIKTIREHFNRFFVFNYWNLWKAFFKSKNYAEEQEVRLLFIPSQSSIKEIRDIETKWVRTDANQIVNQCVDFKGERFKYYPIKIEKVYLGANYPEQALNIVQLNKMAKGTQKMKDIIIVPSSITNYRAPQL